MMRAMPKKTTPLTRAKLENAIAVIDQGLTIKQAAKIKGCHPRTIEAYIERGWLRVYHVGPKEHGPWHRLRLILPEDLANCRNPLPRGIRPDTARRKPSRARGKAKARNGRAKRR